MSHHPHSHQLKRLQHPVNSNHHRSEIPNDEAIRESIEQFTISTNQSNSRSYNPAPHRARRGGGGRFRDRHGHSFVNLPKRAINYDLAESFLDHSTNPLSSDLYKIKFTHSTKRWPNGRFEHYQEKQDKLEGKILDIVCTRTFPIVTKRKKIVGINPNETTTPLVAVQDPVVVEEKKKQVDKQTNIYANLFGGGRIPKLSSANRTSKPSSAPPTTSSSASISLLGELPASDPPV